MKYRKRWLPTHREYRCNLWEDCTDQRCVHWHPHSHKINCDEHCDSDHYCPKVLIEKQFCKLTKEKGRQNNQSGYMAERNTVPH